MTQSSTSTKKMEMEDWLKCNRCYRAVKNSPLDFFVTQCEHIFCGRCVVEARKLCPVCKAAEPQAISVKQIPDQMMHYFSLIAPLNERTFEATRFQRNQFAIIIFRSDQIGEKYNAWKKSYMEIMKTVKNRIIMHHKIEEKLQKLKAIESRIVNENLVRSINNREDRTNQHSSSFVSAKSQVQFRDTRNVPDISNPVYSQRSKLGYAPPSVKSRNHRDSSNSSRTSSDHREKQNVQKSDYSQTRVRPGWNSRLVPQVSMIVDSQKIPTNPAQSRSSTHHHRESQSRRDVENAQRNVRHIQSNAQIANYRYKSNSDVEESMYLSKTIFDTGDSRLIRTPAEKILRPGLNQRIPRSMDTSSNASSSGGTLRYPDSAGSRTNYNGWNMGS